MKLRITESSLFASRTSMGALFLAALLTTLAAPAQAQGINTIPRWDGTSFISAFGVPNTATYGQTVTVVAGATPLKSFSFEIGHCGASVTLRGSVYAWDGSKATGPSLYESPARTITTGDAFQLVTFNVGDLSLVPGTYVLMASTSQDQTGAPSSACRWGSLQSNTLYAGGQFVFINNGPDPAAWTTVTWSSIPRDLAFQVDGVAVAVPAASTASLLICFAGLIAVALYYTARPRRRTS
jgi:hypothetical protein